MHVVAVPATDGTPMFELAIVLEVLASERSASTGVAPADWYDVRLAAAEPGTLHLHPWGVLEPPWGLDALQVADTIVVPPPRDGREEFPAELLSALRDAHERGARIASVCTGAFVLAAAGLLDGRPAITHWSSVDELARRHPRVDVQRTVLYVDDGDVLTSAGSAAGLDLCLHLVRRDHGSRVAGIVARHTVVPPHREGGQAQFVPAAVPDLPASGFSESLDWARRHLDRAFGVDEWARAAGTSPRTFARRFRDTLGSTPGRWLAGERVRRAQELLEGTDLPVEVVADRCGFATAAGLRRPFLREVGTTPQEYRRTFGMAPPRERSGSP